MPLTLKTAPAVEPVSTVECIEHIRGSMTEDSAEVEALIPAARLDVENEAWRSLITQTWELRLDNFLDCMWLERPPVQSVTSVKYLDADNVEQTLAPSVYTVDIYSTPGRVELAKDQVWPTTYDVSNAVTIEFIAGYGLAAAVPAVFKQAIKVRLADYYENRESHVIGSAVNTIPGNAWRHLVAGYRWSI